MVADGIAGVYPRRRWTPAPPDAAPPFFEKAPSRAATCCRPAEALRDLVSFRELNLIGDWPMRGRSTSSSAATW
jgi:chemotaxis protein methyltransferase CheR